MSILDETPCMTTVVNFYSNKLITCLREISFLSVSCKKAILRRTFLFGCMFFINFTFILMLAVYEVYPTEFD